jgi:hypothetical protein
MSDNQLVATQIDYANAVTLLSQQTMSRLGGTVTRGSYRGKDAKVLNQFGAGRFRKRTSRHQSVVFDDVPQNARWVKPVFYDWAEGVDNIDQLKVGIDLTSPLVRVGAAAAGRNTDDVILGSYFASAKTGEDGETTTTFDLNMIVPVDEGGTASGLNVAKLRAGQQLLMARDVDLATQRIYCPVTSVELDQLRREIEIAGSEYNVKPEFHPNGMLKSYMGIEFIHVEWNRQMDGEYVFANRGNMVDGSGYNLLPFYVMDSMHIGDWEGIKAEITDRKDLVSTTQIKMTQAVGATRLDEDKIVQIICNPSA